MTIASIETLSCDAGWRNYHFVKLTTGEGVVGWSEFDESLQSPGVATIIKRLSGRIIGKPVHAHERIYEDLYGPTRSSAGGVVAQAIGAIENALLDAKAKTLGVPCCDLLGGRMRERIPLYWSHCPTWRIAHRDYYKPAINDLDGVKAMGREVREKGFRALKTNLFRYENGKPSFWMPGFARQFHPELNVDRALLRDMRMTLEALREGAGPDVELLIDLNFNAKTEGYLQMVRALAEYEMFWIELDIYNPQALALIRAKSPHPIASCETLIDLRQFLPYFRAQSVDVAIIDTVWNGTWQAMKIAAAAAAHEINVAPHNYYGHLSTMMSAHFSAAVPNFRVMEIDVDRLAWDRELFTHEPQIENGELVLPKRPGWGTEPVEAALRAHPPKS